MLSEVVKYVQSQRSTGFLVVRDGRTLVEHSWPAPVSAEFQANYLHGTAPDGSLLEDVASQQKSFVAVLAAIAADRGLIDFADPVSRHIGSGWSKASAQHEAAISIDHLLQMNSGLNEALGYVAPPGSAFLYNTPAYAILKRVLASAARAPLETLSGDWLTVPAGMANSAWRMRPAAFANVGNPTGLVTTARDVAIFGQLILDGGRAPNGSRIVSEARVRAMFTRSPTNPAYGQLWWLNGGAYAIRALARRTEGPLIPAAPADLVAAFGHLDRKLYLSPSLKLIVVRMGDAALDRDFDQQLWLRLSKAMPSTN